MSPGANEGAAPTPRYPRACSSWLRSANRACFLNVQFLTIGGLTPTTDVYCLSYTFTDVNGWPSLSVAVVFMVMVFRSSETCTRALERYLLVVDRLSHSKVFASICLIAVLSQGAPVTGY